MADDVDLVSDLGQAPDVPEVAATPPAADEPQDVRSILQKAIKEKSTPESTAPGETDGEGRPRNPDGTFAAKPKEGEQQQAPQEQPQQQQQNSQQAQGDVQALTESVISSLPAEAQQSVREVLAARDTAFNNWARPLVEKLSGYDAIDRVIGPRLGPWAMNGLTPEAAINQVLTLSDFATRDPVAFIQVFADQHNIDLSNLPDDAAIDPIQMVQQKVTGLEQSFQSYQHMQQQSAQQAQLDQQMRSIVDQVANAVGQDGQPLRPHYAEVEQQMLELLPGIAQANPGASPQAILEQAYERAIWINPNVREKIVQAQRVKEASEKANRARVAGSSVTGSPAGDIQPAAPAAESLRDAIKLAMSR